MRSFKSSRFDITDPLRQNRSIEKKISINIPLFDQESKIKIFFKNKIKSRMKKNDSAETGIHRLNAIKCARLNEFYRCQSHLKITDYLK